MKMGFDFGVEPYGGDLTTKIGYVLDVLDIECFCVWYLAGSHRLWVRLCFFSRVHLNWLERFVTKKWKKRYPNSSQTDINNTFHSNVWHIILLLERFLLLLAAVSIYLIMYLTRFMSWSLELKCIRWPLTHALKVICTCCSFLSSSFLSIISLLLRPPAFVMRSRSSCSKAELSLSLSSARRSSVTARASAVMAAVSRSRCSSWWTASFMWRWRSTE